MWYVLTDKWIIPPKLRVPKIQFTDHMKFKKEDQSLGASVLLRRGKDVTGVNMEIKCRAETEGRSSRDCPTSGFIPYTVTKPRHYCGCHEKLVKGA